MYGDGGRICGSREVVSTSDANTTTEGARMRNVSHAALPVLLLLSAAACQGKSDRDQTASTTGAAPADTAAGADSTKATTTPKGGLTDTNIVALLDEANKADSAAGALAVKKATNADVKAFARLMMSEHHALRVAARSWPSR